MRGSLVIAASCSIWFTAAALSVPQHWEGNDHYYELVNLRPGLGITWTDAFSVASTRTFDGVVGHLVTVSSAAENEFLYDTFMYQYDRAWMGLRNVDNAWSWIASEPFVYTNWDPDIPQHDGPDWPLDPIVHPFGLMRGFDHLGGWNNLDNYASGSVYGYLVEYEVPEPTTLLFLALGGLAVMRRRSIGS